MYWLTDVPGRQEGRFSPTPLQPPRSRKRGSSSGFVEGGEVLTELLMSLKVLDPPPTPFKIISHSKIFSTLLISGEYYKVEKRDFKFHILGIYALRTACEFLSFFLSFFFNLFFKKNWFLIYRVIINNFPFLKAAVSETII